MRGEATKGNIWEQRKKDRKRGKLGWREGKEKEEVMKKKWKVRWQLRWIWADSLRNISFVITYSQGKLS